jgi:cytosine/uracil/thiamine/allantoin permease
MVRLPLYLGLFGLIHGWTDINFMRMFGRNYENSYDIFHNFFSTYFHKFSKTAYKMYKNSLI